MVLRYLHVPLVAGFMLGTGKRMCEADMLSVSDAEKALARERLNLLELINGTAYGTAGSLIVRELGKAREIME